ncbi:MAG: DUF503 domain-containing protein [Deltaproteobacteria bacterium]|nr:MAG: DUF503 domain-containing protein [Deltaproteobacteria bacterium]
MVVGVCHLDVLIEGVGSLKGKRQVMRSLMDRVKKRFNVSISEVGNQDSWQRAQLGISVVGPDQELIDSVLSKLLSFIEETNLVQVLRSNVEFLHFNLNFFR